MTKKRFRRWLWGTLALVIGVPLVYICTPLTLHSDGRDCGPDAWRLYRFVEDEIVSLHRDVYDIGSLCRRHDDCYARPIDTRAGCDETFRQALAEVCATGPTALSRKQCRTVATSFFLSVRAFGWIAYDWDDVPRAR
jgi:hypothetical protein